MNVLDMLVYKDQIVFKLQLGILAMEFMLGLLSANTLLDIFSCGFGDFDPTFLRFK